MTHLKETDSWRLYTELLEAGATGPSLQGGWAASHLPATVYPSGSSVSLSIIRSQLSSASRGFCAGLGGLFGPLSKPSLFTSEFPVTTCFSDWNHGVRPFTIITGRGDAKSNHVHRPAVQHVPLPPPGKEQPDVLLMTRVRHPAGMVTALFPDASLAQVQLVLSRGSLCVFRWKRPPVGTRILNAEMMSITWFGKHRFSIGSREGC